MGLRVDGGSLVEPERMDSMARTTKYSAEIHGRAVDLVFGTEKNQRSPSAAICSVAARATSERLLEWARRAETDACKQPGASSEESVKLRRENMESRRTNEILKDAVGF